jgi:4-amino-4-deoxy-L-arabinose transferase-like glycosyltransferase
VRRAAVAEGAALAAALGVAVWLFSRSLDARTNYDEGAYLASLDALKHGQSLCSDVFASQPMGFYLLLQAIGGTLGTSVERVRVGFLIVSIVGVIAAYAVGRQTGGRIAGFAAAALLVVAPAFAANAALVEADPPAVAIALVAVGLAVYALERAPTRGRDAALLLTGAAFAAALAVKLLAVAALVPLAALWIRRRPSRRAPALALLGFAAVACAVVLPYASRLRACWRGAVALHVSGRGGEPGFASNVSRVAHFLDPHNAYSWIVIAAIALAAASAAWRRRSTLWPLWSWSAAAVVVLLWQKPLLDHHFVLLAAALAAPCAAALATVAASGRSMLHHGVLVAGGVLALASVVQVRRQLDAVPDAEPPEYVWAAERLEAATPASALVATDVPVLAHLAHRRVPGQLVDTSATRFRSGSLSPPKVLELVDRSGARAVAVGRLFRDYPQIVRGLRARYPRRETRGSVTLYLRGRAP